MPSLLYIQNMNDPFQSENDFTLYLAGLPQIDLGNIRFGGAQEYPLREMNIPEGANCWIGSGDAQSSQNFTYSASDPTTVRYAYVAGSFNIVPLET